MVMFRKRRSQSNRREDTTTTLEISCRKLFTCWSVITNFILLSNKCKLCNRFRISVSPMFCNVCVTGETLLGKVRKIPNFSSNSRASTGLSEVCWTRTTVGGPNNLGGSIIHCLVHQASQQTNMPLSRIPWALSAIIHRTTRCAPDCPVSQRSNGSLRTNGRLQKSTVANNAVQKSEATELFGVAPDCRVQQKDKELQRSTAPNPNGCADVARTG
jgi:hypothetical protein